MSKTSFIFHLPLPPHSLPLKHLLLTISHPSLLTSLLTFPLSEAKDKLQTACKGPPVQAPWSYTDRCWTRCQHWAGGTSHRCALQHLWCWEPVVVLSTGLVLTTQDWTPVCSNPIFFWGEGSAGFICTLFTICVIRWDLCCTYTILQPWILLLKLSFHLPVVYVCIKYNILYYFSLH